VIYNSIEIPTLEPAEETRNVIVTVARLVPWKGVSELIDAVAIVRKEIPDVSLLIIGDGPEQERLMEKGKELLGSAISFTGKRSHEDVLRATRASSVFVLNSSYEGLSHVLIEALHLGKVIVASDAGGNPELIQDEVNGLVVPVDDTNALAQALIKALQDNKMRARLAAHALESSHMFTVPVMISMTRELLISTYPHRVSHL
jgi:glycosyltransferase involved in cell wall biosynthesis